MYLIDTNIFTLKAVEKYIQLRNKEQLIAEAISEIPGEECYITDFVLTELTTLLTKVIPTKYSLTKKQNEELFFGTAILVRDLILKEMNLIFPNNEEFNKGIDLYFNQFTKANKTKLLSLTDCLLLSIAEYRGLELVTLDQKLTAAASRAGIACFNS